MSAKKGKAAANDALRFRQMLTQSGLSLDYGDRLNSRLPLGSATVTETAEAVPAQVRAPQTTNAPNFLIIAPLRLWRNRPVRGRLPFFL